MNKKIGVFVVSMVLCASAMTGCIKIVKTGQEAALTGVVAFSAGDNVANFWETTALPEMEEKSVELSEFLAAAGSDLTSQSSQDYAKYSMGDKGELTYTVKGSGTITDVVTDKKAGYIAIAPDGYTGDHVIKIQVGTVFKGTSIRDSLNFIKFNDYTNQLEWAAVSQSINELVQTTVIDPIGYDNFTVGKKVTFLGAFTVSSGSDILITPTELEMEDGQ